MRAHLLFSDAIYDASECQGCELQRAKCIKSPDRGLSNSHATSFFREKHVLLSLGRPDIYMFT